MPKKGIFWQFLTNFETQVCQFQHLFLAAAIELLCPFPVLVVVCLDTQEGYKTKTVSTTLGTIAPIKTEYWDLASWGGNISNVAE